MQRIDENTYIDDTLVTCAEYQLFTDEMREQEKYYQPDHWSSYQFPAGQAKAPILGVRFSDAVAFCEWLTKRERNGWLYRLPTFDEAIKTPLLNLIQSPLGCWTTELENITKFTWTGPIPTNPRYINIEFPNSYVIVSKLIEMHSKERALETLRIRDNNLVSELSQNITNVLSRAIFSGERVSIINVATGLAIERAITINQVYQFTRSGVPFHGYTFNLDDAIADIDFNCAFDLAYVLKNLNDPDQPIAYKYYNEFILARATTLEIYINLYTLQERIAGRSPAFEGIRLVKERIR